MLQVSRSDTTDVLRDVDGREAADHVRELTKTKETSRRYREVWATVKKRVAWERVRLTALMLYVPTGGSSKIAKGDRLNMDA